MSTSALIIFTLAAIYILLNLYVINRIRKSYYVQEERREFHKKFIWLLPFIGPFLIRSFWQTRKDKPIETVTIEERKKENEAFYESGIAVHGGLNGK